MPDEPQSYGGQGEWVSGKTGQNVNRQKSEPAAEHAAFYEGRRDSETSAPHQGGEVSGVQAQENIEAEASGAGEDANANKRVSGQETGAKRSSFFKDRDYPA